MDSPKIHSQAQVGAMPIHTISRDMCKVEAKQLLTQEIHNKALLDSESDVNEMLSLLTYAPPAIVLAAAFMRTNGSSVNAYLTLLKKDGVTSANLDRLEEREKAIMKTWQISFDEICRVHPLAAKHLLFISCINGINIPQSLLPPGDDSIQQVEALGMLQQYALITECRQTVQGTNQDRYFDTDQAVHTTSKKWLQSHNEFTASLNSVMQRLNIMLPHGGHRLRDVWTTYLPHAVHVAAIGSTGDSKTFASLLRRIGQCQTSLGHYQIAQTTHQRELTINEQELGSEHPQTLISKSCLAEAIAQQGKYNDAELLHREVLKLRAKILGRQAPDTLKSMNNLALISERQGKFKEAEAMHEMELAMCQKVLGPKHQDTLISRNNLALALARQGKQQEAESMHEMELEICQEVLGTAHPDTVKSANNLANALSARGENDQAERLLKQTVVLSSRELGPEHPDTLTCVSNLASVLSEQGRYEEAEALYHEALTLRKKALGAEHPKTLMSKYCLAYLYGKQLRFEESKILYEQVCEPLDTVLGQDHPTSRACRRNYVHLLESQRQGKTPSSLALSDDTDKFASKISTSSRRLSKISISRWNRKGG